MEKDYTGTIIAESLEDDSVLSTLEVLGMKITDDENPADRWHLYTVKVSRQDIERLALNIKSGTWYMHFWKDRHVIAVFKDKVFEFEYDDRATWKDAVEYGKSQGIPEEQLDFIIEV